MAKIDEEELKKIFDEFKQNNKGAFEKLYIKYNKLVYGIVFSILKNKEDSEDVVQIVFEKLYNLDKNMLPTAKESSWLYTLTKNETISFLRKKKIAINLDNIYEIADNDSDINNIIAQDSYNNLISKLNEKEKQIVSLKILGGFSFKEIAKLIDEPIGTVKWRYYKSVHNIKILLGNLGMFVVTFVIGIKTLFAQNRSAEINEEIIMDNETTVINETLEVNESFEDDSRYNSMEQDLSEENKSNVLQSEVEESIEEVQEPVENNYSSEKEINYFGLGILLISCIFLVLTIFLILKSQLKRIKKTSK